MILLRYLLDSCSVLLPIGALLLSLTASGTVLSAQPAQTDQSKEEMIELIRNLDGEIKRQKEKLQEQQSSGERRLDSLKKQRKSTAEELISVRREINRLETTIEETRSTRERLQQSTERLQEQLDRARDLYPVFRSLINRWIEDVPPSRNRSQQRKTLQKAEQQYSEKNPIQALRHAVDVVISLLREGREAQYLETRLRTPDGRRREVELIRTGRSFVAYRTAEESSYGIRIDGKNGYRWQTELSTDQKKQIDEAISVLSSENTPSDRSTGLVLPLDPTQTMSSDSNLTSPTLYQRLVSGGPVMIPLALIALIAALLILERFWTLRRERTKVQTLLEDVQNALRKGEFDRAETICEETPGAVPSVLHTLIQFRNSDSQSIQDRVEEEILRQMPRLERFLPSLNVLAGVAPLLGLLGTVTGIIETFDVISVFGAGNQKLMAGGISEALMTTATGLIIAIPILLVHGYFRSRVDTIVGNMERTAATIYNFMQSRHPEEERPPDEFDVHPDS